LEKGEILHLEPFNRQAIKDWEAKGQLSTREELELRMKVTLEGQKTQALPSEVLPQINQIPVQVSQTMTK
jgi:hypothetical protein